MFELIPELNQLPVYTIFVSFFLVLAFSLIWNRNIEPPQMLIERPSLDTCIHFASERKPADNIHPGFVVVWIAKCMKRKENPHDDEDGHFPSPVAVSLS